MADILNSTLTEGAVSSSGKHRLCLHANHWRVPKRCLEVFQEHLHQTSLTNGGDEKTGNA